MSKPKKHKAFDDAVRYLGGLIKAAPLLRLTKQNLWYHINRKKTPPSLELCLEIERLTKGAYPIKRLRPDMDKKISKRH